jgi:hypothetical protein
MHRDEGVAVPRGGLHAPRRRERVVCLFFFLANSIPPARAGKERATIA